MDNIIITMAENGALSCANNDGGYIEEIKAKQLVITVNELFQSSIISYFTISFEPYGLAKKIVSDNIYKEDNGDDIVYNMGRIFYPLFDYVTISPKVRIQVDGYELDSNGDICAIYKSGILELHFGDSLVGEKIVPSTALADLKLSEKIHQYIDEDYEERVIRPEMISDNSIGTDKIEDGSVTPEKLDRSYATSVQLETLSGTVEDSLEEVSQLQSTMQDYLDAIEILLSNNVGGDEQ